MNTTTAAQTLARRKRGQTYNLSEAERNARRDRMAHARSVLAKRRALAQALADAGSIE